MNPHLTAGPFWRMPRYVKPGHHCSGQGERSGEFKEDEERTETKKEREEE